ncbi:MAG: helix-turn-helix domain-containing protein [Thermoplasmata archaeon]
MKPAAMASRPATSQTGPGASWSEIDVCFREFRESAVRLVERVNDLLGSDQPRVNGPPKDLRLVRSVFGKWSTEVLVALHTAPSMGFEELRRSLPGISPKVLSLKLKAMEQHGMVQRMIVDARPPRVRYTLTERGWTVAWLSDPVLIFLQQAEAREAAQTDGTGGPVSDPTPGDSR